MIVIVLLLVGAVLGLGILLLRMHRVHAATAQFSELRTSFAPIVHDQPVETNENNI